MGYTIIRKIEQYQNNSVLKYKGRKGVQTIVRTGIKNYETIYTENGSFKRNKLTGELVPKTREEIQEVIRVSKERAKTSFRGILEANTWDYFITLTFNSEMQDRLDDNQIYQRYDIFRRWLTKNAPTCYYVTVIERHKKDDVMHFHILLGGATVEELKLITPKELKSQLLDEDKKRVEHWEKPKNYIKAWHMNIYTDRDSEGRINYCFRHFCKYGKNTVTAVENGEKAKTYMVKQYLAKDFGAVDMGRKRYFVSKNCKRPSVIVDEQHFYDVDHIDIENFLKQDLQKYGEEFKTENISYSDKSIDFCKYKINGDISLTDNDYNLWIKTLDKEAEKKEYKKIYTWLVKHIPYEIDKKLKADNTLYKYFTLAELKSLQDKCIHLIQKRTKAIEIIYRSQILECIKELESYGDINSISTLQLVDLQLKASSYQEKFI